MASLKSLIFIALVALLILLSETLSSAMIHSGASGSLSFSSKPFSDDGSPSGYHWQTRQTVVRD